MMLIQRELCSAEDDIEVFTAIQPHQLAAKWIHFRIVHEECKAEELAITNHPHASQELHQISEVAERHEMAHSLQPLHASRQPHDSAQILPKQLRLAHEAGARHI